METLRSVLRWLLALAFVGAGANHFINPNFYVQIMPPYLPMHLELVWLSGIAEVVLGVAILVPKTRRLAGWGLVALLVAVFPANLHMALHPENYADVPSWGLYARLPFQLLFIAWAIWVSRGPRNDPSETSPNGIDEVA